MIRAVVFDVDDTLYDQGTPFMRALKRCFPKESAKMDLTQAYLDFRRHSDAVFTKSMTGEWSLEKMRTYRLIEAMKDGGMTSTSAQARHFQTIYEEELANIQLPTETNELLAELVEKKFKLGVITNGPSGHQWKKVHQLQLPTYIPPANIFVSEDTGFEKPQSEIFQLVERQLNCSPTDLLYVGDSFENDVVGSKRANWQSLWFNHRQRDITDEEVHPDYTITQFSELKTAVLHLLEN